MTDLKIWHDALLDRLDAEHKQRGEDYTSQYILVGRTPIPEPDTLKWAEWHQKADRTVAFTEVDASHVSTVFLGINHSFKRDSKPVLFETMVFGGPLEGEMNRYTTWEDAEAGHQEMVERVKGASL